MEHEWICDNCWKNILFRQPELPGDNPKCEMNEDRFCPECGEEMYFDEVLTGGRLITPSEGD